MSAAERRQFHRILYDAQASLIDAEGHIATQVVDVSLNGALVRRPGAWGGQIGQPIKLEIELGPETRITIEGSVVHLEKDLLGIARQHIDIDSISHLKRLVELNLADESLLQRDLEALG